VTVTSREHVKFHPAALGDVLDGDLRGDLVAGDDGGVARLAGGLRVEVDRVGLAHRRGVFADLLAPDGVRSRADRS